MLAWAPFVTTKVFDGEAQKTLDHIFSQCKSKVELECTIVDFGIFKASFWIPWSDGVGSFSLTMDARKKHLRYNIPPMGPFASVAPPLADAIALELVMAFLKNMEKTVAFFDAGEYEATYLPLVKLAIPLCTSRMVSKRQGGLQTARLLGHAAKSSKHTCASNKERNLLERYSAHVRHVSCFSCLLFAWQTRF